MAATVCETLAAVRARFSLRRGGESVRGRLLPTVGGASGSCKGVEGEVAAVEVAVAPAGGWGGELRATSTTCGMSCMMSTGQRSGSPLSSNAAATPAGAAPPADFFLPYH